jgi:hypothetical protein
MSGYGSAQVTAGVPSSAGKGGGKSKGGYAAPSGVAAPPARRSPIKFTLEAGAVAGAVCRRQVAHEAEPRQGRRGGG